MNKTLQESKCLASLAVFRELYNSKKDISEIISEFIIEIIKTESKHSFNLTEITTSLNSTYDFNLPEAVIKSSLNKLQFLSKSFGTYKVENLADLRSKNINTKKDLLQTDNERIIENLFVFIEENQQRKLSEEEKKKVVHSFISFLIDNTNGNEFAEYISAFIIQNHNNTDFARRLKTIKEGVVLYSGIKFNQNINEVGSWKSDLTIFIETEILFHFAGYNGILFQTLWNDFFNFVKEINRKHPNRIRLRYFSEIKDEVERFFKKAEYIVEGSDKPDPDITAMNTIINGCETKADIITKKAQFFQNLKTNRIIEDDYQNYYDTENHNYNILNKEILEKISKELEIEDVNRYLKFLNYISIRRKEANENNFENVGFILLTGNSKTLNIAWHDDIKIYGNVPLATTLSFLTNKFWFKLNKGFGEDNFPATFEVITKAQIVLSNQLNENVGKKYDELQQSFKNGQLTEIQAKASIIELRRQTRKPEEIRSEELVSILDSISEDSLESFLKEQELFKNKAREESEENKKLKENLSFKEIEIANHLKNQNLLNQEIIKTKRTLLDEKKKSIKILEKQKTPIDYEVSQTVLYTKLKFLILLIISYSLTYYLLWRFGWNNLEQWTWIISFTIPLFISLVYMLIKEKSINPIEILEAQKQTIKNKKYKKFNFDNELLINLLEEKKELKSEIKTLKANAQHLI